MFIFWGTKAVIRKLGSVADFCPICREIRNFQISRIGMAGHLYGLSFGQGRLVGHQKICSRCGVELTADAAIYKDIPKKSQDAGTTQLINDTFPNIRQYYADRFSLEDQVTRQPGQIDAQTRFALIKEPFLLLAPIVEKRFSAVHIDRSVGAALVLTIMAFLAVSYIFNAFFPLAFEQKANAFLITLGIGIAAVGVQGFKSAGRFMRKAIYPKISLALRPLNPSQQELEAVFAELKRSGFKLSKKAKLKDLLPELMTVREAGALRLR
jgi:hypothetical protein